jgi:hypothetical protein
LYTYILIVRLIQPHANIQQLVRMDAAHMHAYVVDIVRSVQTINALVQTDAMGQQMLGNVLFETGQKTHLTIGEWARVGVQMGHERIDDVELIGTFCKTESKMNVMNKRVIDPHN